MKSQESVPVSNSVESGHERNHDLPWSETLWSDEIQSKVKKKKEEEDVRDDLRKRGIAQLRGSLRRLRPVGPLGSPDLRRQAQKRRTRMT